MEKARSRLGLPKILAEIGLLALKNADTSTLLKEVTSRIGRALSVEYCEVLELMPNGDEFLLRSGVGWRDDYVGCALVEAESQAGYVLIAGGPVRVDDVREETRFGQASVLEEHGVRSGITTAIYVQGHIYGVLGAHTTKPRIFDGEEIGFLSDTVEILGAAMERNLSAKNAQMELVEQTEQFARAERRFI